MMKRLAWTCAALLPFAAWAGETKHIRLKSRQDFAGGLRLDRVVLSSKGELRVGMEVEVRSLEGEATALCGALFGGRLYAGTASGRVYAVEAEGEPKLSFETGQLAVTCLAATRTHLYAGTIPDAKTFRMDASGRWEEFRKLPARYVWQLAVSRGEVYAACGLPGSVVRLTGGEGPQVVGEVGAEHALSVAFDGAGVVAGTASPGRLVRLPRGGPQVLHDFRDLEVRAVVARQDGLWVAANWAPRGPDQLIALARSTQGSEPQAAPQAEPKPATAIWRFGARTSEEIVRLPDSLVNSLAPAPDGVFVASNNGARVYRIRADRSFDLELDLAARQATGLVAEGGQLAAVTLGDRAHVARLTGKAAASGTFLSGVQDTGFLSHWGAAKVVGAGAFSIRFRSGAVADPREGWTPWSEPAREFPAAIPVAKGRYLQFEIRLEGASAVVREVEIAYRNQNQPPRLSDLQIRDVPMMIPPEMPPQKPDIVRRPLDIHTPYREIQWQASDPDGDTLSFRLFVRAADSNHWLPLLGGEPTSGASARWDTQTVPDGRYVLRAVASDAASNLAGESLEASIETEPFVVDNGKPAVTFTHAGGGRFRGEARDDWSRIVRFDYRIDGGEWTALACVDGIYDSQREQVNFTVDLSKLPKGEHVLMLRAVDAMSNVGSAWEAFEVK
jgi:hypothetical protein